MATILSRPQWVDEVTIQEKQSKTQQNHVYILEDIQ